MTWHAWGFQELAIQVVFVELLKNAPNNPKLTFEILTNNGELNSLVVCFDIVVLAIPSAL